MKITNKSSVSTQRVKKLVSFVLPHTMYGELARLELTDARRGCGTSGSAKMMDDNPATYEPAAPSVVAIELRQGPVSAPYDDQYVRELPPVHVETWEEEVVLVLAHELRHICQYWKWDPIPDADLEKDAESFAMKLLEKWRSRSTSKAQKKPAESRCLPR